MKGSERKTSPGYPIGRQVHQAGRSVQNGLLRGSDLFSSKLLYPATHSLASTRFEIENDVGILIKVKDGKIVFRIDDDGILS